MFLQNVIKMKKKQQIMLNTFSRSLKIENKRGPGNELGARRAEKFPHLGNYTLTPAHKLNFQ